MDDRRLCYEKHNECLSNADLCHLESRARLSNPSLLVTEKVHEPGNSQGATIAYTESVDDTPSRPYHEAATFSPARVAQPSFSRSGRDILPVTAYEIHGESLDGIPPELLSTSSSGTLIERIYLWTITPGLSTLLMSNKIV